MKFDKETAVVVIVCIILITLCHTFLSPAPAETKPASAVTEEQAEAETKESGETAVHGNAEKSQVSAAKKADIKPVSVPGKNAAPVLKAASVENAQAVFFFNSNGILHEIKAKNIKRTKSEEDIVFKSFPGNEPFTVEVDGWEFISGKVTKVSDSKLTVEQYFRKGNEQITAVKVFTLSDKNAALNCVFQFIGPVRSLNKVTVWGGTLAPLKQFSNDELRDVHQAEYMLAGNGSVKTIDPNVKKMEKFLSKGTDEPVKWVAVSNKYFLSQLYSEKPFNGGTALVNHKENDYTEPGIAGVFRDFPVSKEFKLSLYSGSKAIEEIGKLPPDAQEAIHLAYWSWFEFLCRPMLALLNWLKSISGSYGLAIILLTIIVKLVLWPLIHKGNKSMRKMGKIQPVLKELKEKYKNDPQLFNQKMMELYRQEKVNPMGGCLPMLLQFPVFIALYSTLEAAVELRNVPFLWAKDLSQPDAIGPEIFGYSLHPLILISTGLMVLQMKLSPQTGDPVQRKMMMFMPLIMLIFFYNFPSGLALYWTVNNILSILQMKYSQYAARKEEEREASAGNGSAKAV